MTTVWKVCSDDSTQALFSSEQAAKDYIEYKGDKSLFIIAFAVHDNLDFFKNCDQHCHDDEQDKGERYPPKTLEQQKMTIETFGFGIDNYEIKNGQYIRRKGK